MVLDYLLTITYNTLVNCKANSGYTLLHLAASSGHLDCVKIHDANISIEDDFEKTPIDTAKLAQRAA